MTYKREILIDYAKTFSELITELSTINVNKENSYHVYSMMQNKLRGLEKLYSDYKPICDIHGIKKLLAYIFEYYVSMFLEIEMALQVGEALDGANAVLEYNNEKSDRLLHIHTTLVSIINKGPKGKFNEDLSSINTAFKNDIFKNESNEVENTIKTILERYNKNIYDIKIDDLNKGIIDYLCLSKYIIISDGNVLVQSKMLRYFDLKDLKAFNSTEKTIVKECDLSTCILFDK
ncbi:MAG: hypothetical protein IJ593_10595 [Lachnospiraceae bacterium]|nr:hypothetical protein [Lachnospiraceae bacterium]